MVKYFMMSMLESSSDLMSGNSKLGVKNYVLCILKLAYANYDHFYSWFT